MDLLVFKTKLVPFLILQVQDISHCSDHHLFKLLHKFIAVTFALLQHVFDVSFPSLFSLIKLFRRQCKIRTIDDLERDLNDVLRNAKVLHICSIKLVGVGDVILKHYLAKVIQFGCLVSEMCFQFFKNLLCSKRFFCRLRFLFHHFQLK